MPNLYIIAGCNGAGKTTASFTVLPELLGCKEFVNADEIARGLSPFQPEKVAIEAGRVMLSRIDYLLKLKKDFAFETTLASKGYVRTIERAKANGYFVTLVFFWLEKVELAIERVKIRVAEGGHHVPEEVIRRRYRAGIRNFFSMYKPVCDYWMMFNNSENPMHIIAEGRAEGDVKIFREKDWEELNQIENEC